MDADILRLTLFLAGVALIVGIYFWDRHKKINAKINAIHKAERRQREIHPDKKKIEKRQEPVWQNDDLNDDLPEDAEAAEDDLTETLKELGEIVEEKGARRSSTQPPEQTAFEFDKSQRSKDVRVPEKILQINVMARNRAINGDTLMRVARDLQLEAGEMEIFHRYTDDKRQRKPIFSMASLVEPGTFPFDSMSEFTTPGVTLFAQLPGPRDGQETFEQMLTTAQRLAALLDAELLDQTRSVLSRQTIEHIRQEISEHSRLVRLSRSR